MTRPAGLAALLILFFAGPAFAVFIDKPLPDPAAEARAQSLMGLLRCLVCQNQSIHDSNAPLAKDLRVLVRERIAAGDSNDAAMAYIVQRYGDWVLLEPPFKATTWALWLGPAVILVLSITGGAVFLRRQRRVTAAPVPLSTDEEARLARLLDDRER